MALRSKGTPRMRRVTITNIENTKPPLTTTKPIEEEETQPIVKVTVVEEKSLEGLIEAKHEHTKKLQAHTRWFRESQ